MYAPPCNAMIRAGSRPAAVCMCHAHACNVRQLASCESLRACVCGLHGVTHKHQQCACDHEDRDCYQYHRATRHVRRRCWQLPARTMSYQPCQPARIPIHMDLRCVPFACRAPTPSTRIIVAPAQVMHALHAGAHARGWPTRPCRKGTCPLDSAHASVAAQAACIARLMRL